MKGSTLFSNASSPLPEGFAYLHDMAPSIQFHALYAGHHNFTGAPVLGYTRNVVVVSVHLGRALIKAQEMLKTKGYELVVYDAYRPQQAVDAFCAWAQEPEPPSCRLRSLYYPALPKNMLFDAGYIARKSSHTRGAAVDLSILPKGFHLSPQEAVTRVKTNQETYTYLDDGSMDMGTHVDFLDIASHVDSDLISRQAQALRHMLRDVMRSCGMVGYSKEWWHFQLEKEPFPDTYFDFPIV